MHTSPEDYAQMQRCVERYAARTATAPRPRQMELVYFVADDTTGHTKIGRTATTMEQRLCTLRNASKSRRLRVLAVFETLDSRTLERDYHKRFADRRLSGEWFALTPDDLNAAQVSP